MLRQYDLFQGDLPYLHERCVYNCSTDSYKNPETLTALLCKLFPFHLFAEEYCYMVALNSENHFLGIFEVAHGQVNQCYVSIRECAIRALLCGAAGVIFLHNHPANNETPSAQDISMTEQLKKGFNLLEISFIDHIIVCSNGNFFSFYEKESL